MYLNDTSLEIISRGEIRHSYFFILYKVVTLNKEQILSYVLNNPDYFDFAKQEIIGRLNTNDNLTLEQIQKKFIEEIYQPLTKEEIEKILPASQKAESELYPILHKMGINITEPMKWIVIKSKDDYNWDLCYTQGNVIVLSQKKIDSGKDLARTLAHEMVHIYQRKYPKLFRKFYKEKMGFEEFNPNEKQLESIEELGIDKIYVENPDYCEMGLMIFKNKYLPISVILEGGKTPVNIVLEVDENGVTWNNKSYGMNSYDKMKLDQPNEMFAYTVTKNIK